jgi:hypothetical protein
VLKLLMALKPSKLTVRSLISNILPNLFHPFKA